jgi:hypothetical protein
VFGVKAWTFGAHAEYVCMRQGAALAAKPAGVGFEEAAAVCDGVILALMCLRRADLRNGRSILVYGASGSIGTAAVQLSRHFGADVTAVCGTKNLDLMTNLGADRVIDYTQEDFTKNGQGYDVIFDAVGKHSFRRCRDSLNPGGTYLATDDLRNLLLAQWTRFGDKKVIFPIPPRYTKRDVLFLKGLMEAGQYRAVIDKRHVGSQKLVGRHNRRVQAPTKVGKQYRRTTRGQQPIQVGSSQLEEPEDATAGASRTAHRRHTGRVSLRRKPRVEANGGLKDQAPAKAGDGSLASQRMQSAAQAKECIDGKPGGSRFRRELESDSPGELKSPGRGASCKLAAGTLGR